MTNCGRGATPFAIRCSAFVIGGMMSGRRKIRVGVIFGGRSGEHDVSLRSARAVMEALDPERFEVVPIGITREGHWLAGGDPLARLEAGSDLARLEGRAGEAAPEATTGS